MRASHLTAALVLAAVLSLVATQSVFGAHAVRYSGTGHIKGTWSVDFDDNMFNDPGSGEDLNFDVVTQSERYLDPLGTAGLLKMGTTRPGYAKCASTKLASSSYQVRKALLGVWFCLKTQNGRFVRFKVVDIDPYPGGIDLRYTTWEL